MKDTEQLIAELEAAIKELLEKFDKHPSALKLIRTVDEAWKSLKPIKE